MLLQQDGLLTLLILLVVCMLRGLLPAVLPPSTRVPAFPRLLWLPAPRSTDLSSAPCRPFGHQVAPHANSQLLADGPGALIEGMRDAENLPRRGWWPDPTMRMILSDLEIHKILPCGGKGLSWRPLPGSVWTQVPYTKLQAACGWPTVCWVLC